MNNDFSLPASTLIPCPDASGARIRQLWKRKSRPGPRAQAPGSVSFRESRGEDELTEKPFLKNTHILQCVPVKTLRKQELGSIPSRPRGGGSGTRLEGPRGAGRGQSPGSSVAGREAPHILVHV